MELERFGKFTLLIDGIYKNIHKIKLNTAPYLGIKSVHVFWIYLLRKHPDGLTATELAAAALGDKKRAGDNIILVVPFAIGDSRLVRTPVDKLEEFIEGGL